MAWVQPVHRHVEIGRHAVRRRDETAVEIVGPRVVRTTEHLRVSARPELFDREPRIFRRRVLIVTAQSRSAVTAHVVVRLDGAGSVAEDDDAVAAAVREHEIVAGLRDTSLVVGEQPEMRGDEPFIGEVMFFVDVVLRRNRGPLAPPFDDRRRARSLRLAVRQRNAVAEVGHGARRIAAVREIGRRRSEARQFPRHRCSLCGGGSFGRGRAGKQLRIIPN